MSLSSKSLFRATKPKPRPDLRQVALGDFPEAVRPREDVRRADDFYPTGQPEAIRALLARDGAAIRSCGAVWEPACGDGALVRELRAAGLPCVASDLIDRGCPDAMVLDFFTVDFPPCRAIITNPPYDLINARDGRGRWLSHTLDLPGWDYLALLLSADWDFARSNGLGALIDANPYSYCYKMRWKLDFTGEGSPPQRNVWMVWDRRDPRSWHGRGPHPEPSIRMMDRDDARQAELALGGGA